MVLLKFCRGEELKPTEEGITIPHVSYLVWLGNGKENGIFCWQFIFAGNFRSKLKTNVGISPLAMEESLLDWDRPSVKFLGSYN